MAKEPIKDPKGGLTAAGRAHFKRKEGANLKPGVKGPANTPEKMRRKGSFLTRFFTNPSGPMTNDKGEPTRLALSAAAWGEPVPKNRSDAAKLAAKGRRLLDRYEKVKKHAEHDQTTHGRRKSSFSERMAGISPDRPSSPTPTASEAIRSSWDESSDRYGKSASVRGVTAYYKSGGKQYEYKITARANEDEDGARWEADVVGLNNDREGGNSGSASAIDEAKKAIEEWVSSFVSSGSVKKHGGSSHDQKTHGRRKTATGGGTGTRVRRIMEATGKSAKALAAMARGGGFTFNPKRNEMRSKGVAVAIGKENERKVKLSDFSADDVRKYANEKAELLALPNHHLGAWKENVDGVDFIFLDVSVVVPTLERAADLGRTHDQIGIFDLSTFTTHYRTPNKEGEMRYVPYDVSGAEGYAESARADMVEAIGKADGDTGVMLVPGEMLDDAAIDKIAEKVKAMKAIPKESRKNS